MAYSVRTLARAANLPVAVNKLCGLWQLNLSLSSTNQFPDPPKRPPSAYFSFIQDQYQSFSNAHPDLKRTDIVKQLAQDWKKLDDALKEKYNSTAKVKMDVYQQSMEKYMAKLDPAAKKALAENKKEKRDKREKSRVTRAKRKLAREMERPVSPGNAYTQFVVERMTQRGTKSTKVYMAELARAWKALDVAEKEKFKQREKQLREKYDEQLSKWESSMLVRGHTELVRKETLETFLKQQRQPSA